MKVTISHHNEKNQAIQLLKERGIQIPGDCSVSVFKKSDEVVVVLAKYHDYFGTQQATLIITDEGIKIEL